MGDLTRLSISPAWRTEAVTAQFEVGLKELAFDAQGMLTLAGVAMASGMSCHCSEAKAASRTQAM